MSLTFALTLLAGGCALLYWEFFGDGRVPGMVILFAIFMIVFGGFWFFSDLS